MAILLGSSFAVLRFGHLMHHRYNRNPIDRPDVYDPALGSRFRARLGFLFNLICGVYLIELAVPLVCLLPRPFIRRVVERAYRGDDPALRAIRQSALRLFLDSRRLATIRTDALLSAGLIGLSALLFGDYWPLLAAFLLARAVMISVFDNVYHFATPIDRPEYARNLWLPAPFRLLILNMNLHRVHHGRPALPWWSLPAEMRAAGDDFDAKLFPAAIAQFAGPVPVGTLLSRETPRSKAA
jgi:fatty acid desaturase